MPASILEAGRFLMTLGATLLFVTGAHANPVGGTVRHGSATIDQNGNQLTINQASGMAILDWNSFSIAQGETTRFNQPNSSSMALNRVNGGTQSLINGRLEANGGIVLINPAGIIVGKSGVINVNTFIASTHDVTDDDFLSGKAMRFKGSSDASIQNLGTIHAESGDIYLIAHSVVNEGTLSAKNGTVGLVAANEVLLQPSGDEKLSILSQEASGGKILHRGTIEAVSAEIKAAGNPYAVAINLDGVIQARGVSGKKAKVAVDAGQGDIQMSKTAKIDAGGDSEGGKVIVQSKGNLEIAGTILATSASGNGGEVQLLGDSIHLASTAVVDASGFAGGGIILVGGDYQGGNNPAVHYSSTSLPNAQTLQVDQGAKLMANATGNGNGGTIIQWSDGTTVSSGAVSVQGGPLGGNGGFAEISGKQNLGFNGSVELLAPSGKAGTVLFDPTTLYILSDQLWVDSSFYYPNYNLNPYNPTLGTSTPNNYSSLGLISVSQLANITSGTIELSASSSIEFFAYYGSPSRVPPSLSLQPGVNLVLNAPSIILDSGSSLKANGSGNITFNAGSISTANNTSIRASGSGWIQMYASQNLNLGGSIQTDTGYIQLHAQNGNINLSPGSTIQQNNGGISIWTDYGSLLGSSHINSVANGISLSAYTHTPGTTLGSIDFSGEIKTGLNGISSGGGIHLDARNTLTFNGILNSVGGDINLNGNQGINLGNVNQSTTVTTANNWISLAAPSIQLNGTTLSAANGGISINNGNQMILASDGLATITSASGNIFNNLSASQINLQANTVSFTGQTINLPPDTSLTVQAYTGGLTLPSGSSISAGTLFNTDGTVSKQASGNGDITLMAGTDLVLSGDITSYAGQIFLRSALLWPSADASIELNGRITSDSGFINFNGYGGRGIVLGDNAIIHSKGNINFEIDTTTYSAASIALNKASVISDLGLIRIYEHGNLILGGNATTLSSTKSDGIMGNLSAPYIYLQGYNVSLNNASLAVSSGESLTIRADGGSGGALQMISGSITAAGNGSIQLFANNKLNFGGAIVSADGFVKFESQIGNLYLTPGSSINQTGAGGIALAAYTGSILGSSVLSSALGPINLLANNNGNSFIETYKVGSINFSGSISTGSASGNAITINAGNGILGIFTLAFQNGLSTFSSSLQQIVAKLSANSSMTLQAPQITLIDTEIRLNPNVSLGLFASGSASLPGTLNLTRDTIIAQGNGIISLTGNGNVSLSGTSITPNISTEQGTITITSLIGNIDLSAQLSTTASGASAVEIAAGGNFTASANATIATPNGRWVIYSTDPSLNVVDAPTLQSGNAIYAMTASSLSPSSIPYPGNYYVYTAPILATSLAPPASTPSSTTLPPPVSGSSATSMPPPASTPSATTTLNTIVTTLVSTPSFMRVASAVMAPPAPMGGGMGPVGSPAGGGFGAAGPSGGVGGFSSGASFGGPAPNGAPAPSSASGAGGAVAGGPGSPSAPGAPGGEGAAPPPPGGEGSSGGPGAAPAASGAPVAGGPGGEAAPGAPAPSGAAPAASGSQASSSGAGGPAPAGAPGGAGLAGTAASAPHVPTSVAAANRMNNPIPSSVGPAHSLNAMSGGSEHGAVEAGGVSSGPAASGPGKATSSVGGRSGTMGFGSDPQSAESANSMLTTIITVL